MVDPFFPIPEVRKMNHQHVHVDNYSERWVTIDGIETKIANLAAAQELCTRQDGVRVQIRADLDALGIRDKLVTEEITLEDGTKTTVELLPPGANNVIQFDEHRASVNTDRATETTTRTRPARKPTLWQRVKKLLHRKAR